MTGVFGSGTTPDLGLYLYPDLLLSIAYLLANWVAFRLAVRLCRGDGIPVFTMRKVFHMATALLFVPVVLLYRGIFWGVVVSALMVGMNVLGVVRRRRHELGRPLPVPELIRPLLFHLAAWLVLLALWLSPVSSRVLVPILVLGVGDATAALVGRRWGRRRLPGFHPGKTVAGMLAGTTAAALVLVLVTRAGFFGLSAGGWKEIAPALAVLLEPFLPGQMDNPALMMAAGGLCLLLTAV
ncbi:MAG: hypothetical protein JXQ27_02405 [Acidobacteria bacterium]|nr:hypothetical protein [Acidobacteriota bacterium]